MKNIHKAVEMLTKVSTMSARIEPNIRYLADLAAREDDCSLTRYIEKAIENALKVEGSPHLLNEGLWDEDPAKRLFLLVTARPDLMNDTERQLWKRIRSMPELLDKFSAVDRNKLSSNWSAVIGTGKV